MEYLNKVKLYGRVTREFEYSHEYNSVPFYSLELEVPQFRSKNQKIALVRCYFSGDLLAQNEIKTGLLLEVYGKFINSKIKGVIDISVLVESYKVIEDYPEDDSTEAEVSGEVTNIFTNQDNYKGLINFVIASIDDEGVKSFSTRVIIWGRLADHVYNNLSIGDKVLIKGVVNNSKTNSRIEGEESEQIMVSEILGTYFTKL